MIFFSFQCIYNALILALYAVHAFSDEHLTCFAQHDLDLNITETFTMAFKLGFYLHLAIFVNATYIDLYC